MTHTEAPLATGVGHAELRWARCLQIEFVKAANRCTEINMVYVSPLNKNLPQLPK